MKIKIDEVATLANIPLGQNEKNVLEKQLEETLSYIERLNTIDTVNVKPTNQVTGLENITRNDSTCPSLSQEQALQNTQSQYNGLFKVGAILGQSDE